MKRLLTKGLLLVALIVGTALQLSAQSVQVIVTMRDGSEQSYDMMDYDRMFFENNEKLVIEKGVVKENIKIPLADIRKVTCYETDNSVESLEQTVSVYPNPVHETLTLRNLSGLQTVNIYSLDGRLVKSAEVVGEQPVNVSDLTDGIYLVKTSSFTLKMIKL